MVYLTFLYLLLVLFVIWVWSPPAIIRMIILIGLIILYSLSTRRIKHKTKS